MDTVDKVKLLIKEKKMSQKDVAKVIGTYPANMSDILKRKGRYFSTEHIPKLAKLFNVDESYLLGSETNKQKIHSIPLIGLASCGIPQEYDLNGYEQVPVSEDIYAEGMYAVRAEGDSMSPKINNGAIVYCNANRHIDNGNIVHYCLNGESGIKKYKMNERGDIISLIPINSDFDVVTIHADDGLELKMARIVGVVDTNF